MAVEELSETPGLTGLYAKALVGAGRSAVQRLPGLGQGERRLPDRELMLRDAEVDRQNLVAYDRVCGFRLRDELPATYPHLLAFPLAMELMTSSDFPFPVIGLVHIENRIEQLRPIDASERLGMKVHLEGLGEHERGTQFEIHAEGEASGEPAWRSVNTYLHREGESSGDGKQRDKPEPPPPDAVWELPGDVGRRYAEVSGDRNPIHLHPLSARLFGMPRPIAHGMWVKARCLAALESVLPGAYTVEVRFKLPVLLPGRVEFASWPEGDGRSFAVHDAGSGKPHLAGTVR
jgi:MaoC like domain